jgi:flagellar biosynthetic protein FliO
LLPATARAEGPVPTATVVSFLKPYADPAASPVVAPPWWALSLDLAWKLALIVALIYLTVWLLRRFMNGTRGAAWRPGAVNVLDTTFLAPNRALYLVELGERVLLLGATPTQLSTLSEVADPEQVARLRERYARPAGPGFAEQVRTIADRLGAHAAPLSAGDADLAADPQPTFADGGAFLRERVAELRRLSRAFDSSHKGKGS